MFHYGDKTPGLGKYSRFADLNCRMLHVPLVIRRDTRLGIDMSCGNMTVVWYTVRMCMICAVGVFSVYLLHSFRRSTWPAGRPQEQKIESRCLIALYSFTVCALTISNFRSLTNLCLVYCTSCADHPPAHMAHSVPRLRLYSCLCKLSHRRLSGILTYGMLPPHFILP